MLYSISKILYFSFITTRTHKNDTKLLTVEFWEKIELFKKNNANAGFALF
ncbi:hypothetical protein LEP1GSC059_4266 [Leptospira noguchii serovar Panama str. CZ214]|uniref:Uncharacterized protein n=1 Tax=Leptospira noguchii serovar Panama str. CZ214 TaxID=1001595 RepID=T0FFK8_9LEPT|nr:hypothetical protein LEP1GSC059_4266 [Leptospira noguchii serovar Panama str. CZ214]